MARAPHRRCAAVLPDPWRELPRALHVEDDLATLAVRQDVLREQHDLPVGIDDLAVLGHHPETVAVAVEGQAEFGIGLAQAADQVLEILGMRGVRVVVREGAIDVAEQFDDVAAERAVQPRRDRATDAIAAVDRDLHRPGQLHVADDTRQVLLDHLGLPQLARLIGALEAAVLDPLAQRLDPIAVQRLAGDHHLQAVVFGGVVAAGDLDAGAGSQEVRGEVEDRRGDHADVDHADAGRADAFDQGRRQLRAGEATVAADDHLCHAALSGGRTHRRADRAHGLDGERGVDHAADVVCLEDAWTDH